MPVGPGAPSQLKSKPTVPAGSYMAVMLVSSLVQVMPGCDNRSTRLGTWLMDQLLSLTSDCSCLMDQPAGLYLTLATSPGLILTCGLTSQLQIWPASSPQICLIIWMPGWTSISGAALPAMALPLAPGLTAVLALQSIFWVIWYGSGLVTLAQRFSSC